MYLFKRHGLAVRVSLVWSREKHTALSAKPIKILRKPQDYRSIHTLSEKHVDPVTLRYWIQ
jgi:hypothetical protein